MQRHNAIRTARGAAVNFEQSIREGYAKKVPIDNIRAKSIIVSSKQAIATAKNIAMNKDSLKSIFRELYEGLRQQCEAIGYQKGYKFQTHEAITYFIKDILEENTIANKFDRHRKKRNGINYYGDDIVEETVKEALKEIPELMKELEKHIK